jgi:hypothetical protein
MQAGEVVTALLIVKLQARLGQSMWDLWWTKWHWDRFISEYFSFPLPISFHQCSITWKNEKN